MNVQFEPIRGRYVRLDLLGRPHRVYVEEAGEGPVLLCLHTAGSDSRQWRGLMNDAQLLSDWRVVAFDLPRHGKSSPPEGWEDEEYLLGAEDYTAIVRTMMDALGLERPVLIGCSIGGRLALHFALTAPERFRAIIGLQAGARVKRFLDTSWLHRSDVHGGEVCGATMSGLVAPMSPRADRWETLWHYMQSGPGVFKGDLHFYQKDGVLERLDGIDTSRCPLYLLTGEYDYSCRPEDTLEVARQVPGARARIMPGLGHFPMSENPERFLEFLRPVLDEIRHRP